VLLQWTTGERSDCARLPAEIYLFLFFFGFWAAGFAAMSLLSASVVADAGVAGSAAVAGVAGVADVPADGSAGVAA
jgi:hypothetical protein